MDPKISESRKFWISVSIIAWVVCAVFTFPGVASWLYERTFGKKERQAINAVFNQSLLPAAAWVESFHGREGRLPTDSEINAYTTKTGIPVRIMRDPPPWGVEWHQGWTEGKDFVLCDGIPDWNLYYRSTDRQRIEACTD